MAISILESLTTIQNSTHTLPSELLPLEISLGRVSAVDVKASLDLPRFDNSAMDGYAISLEDASKRVKISQTLLAGEKKVAFVQPGEAIKIMTGAKIPQGTDAVVPFEEVKVEGEFVWLPSKIKNKANIRLMGEDIKKGDLLIEKGERLGAYGLTMLASQGISHLWVTKRPKVAILATGKELKMHWQTIGKHEIYNSNAPTFMARSVELGCDASFVGSAKDSVKSIIKNIESCLDADLIITSGGVSVGEADFTREAFRNLGFKEYFCKIDIKPGKPTTFGKIGKTLVINLPGNPLAAAINFEIFGKTIILGLLGAKKRYIGTIDALLRSELSVKPGRPTVIPGIFDGREFEPAKKFGPGMVSPLGHSNGFIILGENVGYLPKGSRVKFIPITWDFSQEEFGEFFTR